jgi:hypothetical protein
MVRNPQLGLIAAVSCRRQYPPRPHLINRKREPDRPIGPGNGAASDRLLTSQRTSEEHDQCQGKWASAIAVRPRPDDAPNAECRKPVDAVSNQGTSAPHKSPSWIAGIPSTGAGRVPVQTAG